MSSPALLGCQRISDIGSDVGISHGPTITAHASANTKGSYTEIISSTPHDAHWIMVTLGVALREDFLVDIAIGGAGSEQIVIANFPHSNVPGGGQATNTTLIPVFIPAGSRVSARCQATTGAAVVRIALHLLQMGALSPGSAGFVETYGANTGDSGGAQLDSGGSANTKGSYTEITSATSRPIRWLVLCIGNMNNSARQDTVGYLDIAIGAAGSEQVIVPNIPIGQDSGADMCWPAYVSFPIDIPAGSRIAARTSWNFTDATDRLIDLIVLGAG